MVCENGVLPVEVLRFQHINIGRLWESEKWISQLQYGPRTVGHLIPTELPPGLVRLAVNRLAEYFSIGNPGGDISSEISLRYVDDRAGKRDYPSTVKKPR